MNIKVRVAALLGVVGAAGGVMGQQCPGQWVTQIGSPGLNANVYALMNWDPDGAGPLPPRLVVGGEFTTAGGFPANRVASWNGSWSALGTGISGPAPVVYALATLGAGGTGNLVAGGYFNAAGGVAVSNLAEWNGTTWATLFGGVNERVRALARFPDGTLAVGGEFTSTGVVLANHVARYLGPPFGWGSFGGGTFYDVWSLAIPADGSLLAGQVGSGAVTEHLQRWNGSWGSLGSGVPGGVRAVVVLPNGNVVAGGAFTTAGGVGANFIARWNGTAWSALGSGMNNFVLGLAAAANGDVIACGAFTTAGGVTVNRVARWDGTTWSAFGSGVNDIAYAVTVMPDGDVVVGGQFTNAGGSPVGRIARWSQPAACYANCDCSGGSPALTANDFQCFINAFSMGGTYANCDGSTVAPVLTANDFQCFLNRYSAGCS